MAEHYQLNQSAVSMCNHHLKEELDSYCFTCKLRICEECCRGDHKDHDWRRSKKAAREIRENWEDRTQNIEEIISGLERDKEEEADIDRIEQIKMEYKFSIDDWAEKMKAKRRAGRTKRMMTEEIGKLKKMLKFYDKDVQSVKDSVILEVEEDFHNLKYKISTLSNNTQGKKLKFKKGELSPGVLHCMLGDIVEDKTASMVKVTERSHFTHVDDLTGIYKVVPVTHDEALVRRVKTTQMDHVDMTGKVINEKKSLNDFEDFIKMENDIIYTHVHDKMIRRMSFSGTVSDVHSTAPLHPTGICTTLDGGILVALCEGYIKEIKPSSRGQILHINTKAEVTRRYGHAETHADKVLVHPYRVEQNVNMDLCVVDILDKNHKCRLVVLTVTSKLKFSYTGQPTLKEDFSPDDVACDNRGRILVTDYFNHVVHVLRWDGHFLGLILTEQSFDRKPMCLGLYDDTLWVGCDKGEVRVYRYIEDEN